MGTERETGTSLKAGRDAEVEALLGKPQGGGAAEVELGPCPHLSPPAGPLLCPSHPFLLVQAALAAALAQGTLPAFLPCEPGKIGVR